MEHLDDYVDITEEKNRGVLKKIITEGNGEHFPTAGSEVHVHYVGTLFGGDKDGEKFDSSRDRGDLFKFTLGEGQVIKAWDIGVATMKRGEVCELICASDYAYGDSGSGPKIPPKATLKFEVELFTWKGKDISPDSDESIIETKLKPGTGYDSPKDGANVDIALVGTMGDIQFDSRSVSFELGDGSAVNVVPGVEIALKKMKKGQTSQLEIKSRYGFGTTGSSEFNIPSNTTIQYQVTLNSFEKFKESWNLEGCEEKIKYAEEFKLRGTDRFKAQKFQLSSKFYEKAIGYIDSEHDFKSDDQLKERRRQLLLALHLNQALCALRMDQSQQCLTSCQKALEQDAQSDKALFRRGQALLAQKEWSEAREAFQQVLQIDQKNQAARQHVQQCSRHIKEAYDKEKSLYRNIFDKMSKYSKDDDPVQPATNGDKEENEKVEETTNDIDMMEAQSSPAVV